MDAKRTIHLLGVSELILCLFVYTGTCNAGTNGTSLTTNSPGLVMGAVSGHQKGVTGQVPPETCVVRCGAKMKGCEIIADQIIKDGSSRGYAERLLQICKTKEHQCEVACNRPASSPESHVPSNFDERTTVYRISTG